MGIEPTLVAWEATVLPLNYTRFAVRFYAAARPTGKLTAHEVRPARSGVVRRRRRCRQHRAGGRALAHRRLRGQQAHFRSGGGFRLRADRARRQRRRADGCRPCAAGAGARAAPSGCAARRRDAPACQRLARLRAGVREHLVDRGIPARRARFVQRRASGHSRPARRARELRDRRGGRGQLGGLRHPQRAADDRRPDARCRFATTSSWSCCKPDHPLARSAVARLRRNRRSAVRRPARRQRPASRAHARRNRNAAAR